MPGGLGRCREIVFKKIKINRDNENTREKPENARKVVCTESLRLLATTCQRDLLYCGRLNVKCGSANKKRG